MAINKRMNSTRNGINIQPIRHKASGICPNFEYLFNKVNNKPAEIQANLTVRPPILRLEYFGLVDPCLFRHAPSSIDKHHLMVGYGGSG